jgi:hypothetical protein
LGFKADIAVENCGLKAINEAQTSVGVSPETFLLLLQTTAGQTFISAQEFAESLNEKLEPHTSSSRRGIGTQDEATPVS